MNFRLGDIKSVIIVDTFGIGDVLFTTPLVRTLKDNLKGVKIGFVCNARTAELLYKNPNIDEVFVYERDEWHELWKKSKAKYLLKFWKFISCIKKSRFDLAIDLSLSGVFSFLLWFIGIKKRLGYNYKNRSFLSNYKLELKSFSEKHVVEYYFDLLRSIGIQPSSKKLELFVPNEDLNWAEGFLSAFDISSKDLLIAIIPGGGASWGKNANFKHWAVEGFAEVANKLVEKYQAKIIICGSYSELEICNKVKNLVDSNAVNACGKTGLMQLAALLSKCKVVIANDGGPLHMAVALGRNTVSIFGPVDDLVYGPYPKDRHIVVKVGLNCQPCYKNFRMAPCVFDRKCLSEIKSERILQEVGSLL